MTVRLRVPRFSPPTLRTLDKDECANVVGDPVKWPDRTHTTVGSRMTVKI